MLAWISTERQIMPHMTLRHTRHLDGFKPVLPHQSLLKPLLDGISTQFALLEV